MKYCRESVLALGIGDENTEFYKQDEIDKLADSLGTSLSSYNFEDLPQNDPSTWNNKIEVLNLSNQIYKIIYGDNLMYYHSRLSQNYLLISTYQIAQGKTEEALETLEKMCYHAIANDKSYINDHGKYFTSADDISPIMALRYAVFSDGAGEKRGIMAVSHSEIHDNVALFNMCQYKLFV